MHFIKPALFLTYFRSKLARYVGAQSLSISPTQKRKQKLQSEEPLFACNACAKLERKKETCK